MTPEPDAPDYFAGLYQSSDDPWMLRCEKRVNVCYCVFSLVEVPRSIY
jgi:hypothetical protein